MDALRFDTLTRTLASGKSRRDALRVLAGAGVSRAVASPVRAGDGHCAEFENSCDAHTKCCKPYVCINTICLDCIKAGDTFCQSSSQCCGKATCEHGKCIKDENAACEGQGCKKKRKKRKKRKKH
ncbi:MAG: hypothetical protein KC432_01585 [Thermomicrobiales bacterium]|nr:hypothetical protein [Thermomicrobiales bacterium]